MGEWGSDVWVFFGVVSGVTHACRDGLIGGREPSNFCLETKVTKNSRTEKYSAVFIRKCLLFFSTHEGFTVLFGPTLVLRLFTLELLQFSFFGSLVWASSSSGLLPSLSQA